MLGGQLNVSPCVSWSNRMFILFLIFQEVPFLVLRCVLQVFLAYFSKQFHSSNEPIHVITCFVFEDGGRNEKQSFYFRKFLNGAEVERLAQ